MKRYETVTKEATGLIALCAPRRILIIDANLGNTKLLPSFLANIRTRT